MNQAGLKTFLERIFESKCFWSRFGETGLEASHDYNPLKYTFGYKAPRMKGYWWIQVDNYATFERKYLDLSEQGVLPLHFYEELQQHVPSKIYFDIECDSWQDMYASRQDLEFIAENFADALRIVFQNLFVNGDSFDAELLRWSEACNDTKFSMHVVYQGYTQNNEVQKRVAEELIRVIESDDAFIMLRKKSSGTVIDKGVYTKRRLFRHLFSWKDGAADRDLRPFRDDCPIFSEYVIQQLYADDEELIFKPSILSESLQSLPTLRAVRHVHSQTVAIESPLLQEIQRIVLHAYSQASMYTTTRTTAHPNTVTVGFFPNGACPHGKHHHSNHCYVRYNRSNKMCTAHCFSAKCPKRGVVIQEAQRLEEWIHEVVSTEKINSRYLTTEEHTPIIELREHWRRYEVVMVKSATDTGKTAFLEWCVNKIKQRNAQAVITSVGCRQSFASNSAPRLGIRNYQDLQAKELNTENTAVVQLDSLLKNDCGDETRERDLLILDETTALLAHLLGDTLKQKQRAIYKKLRALMKRAKKIVCVCADLDEKSIAFLKAVVPDKSIGLLLNEWKDHSRKVYLYSDKAQFEAKLFEELEKAQKVAYCNSHCALDVKRITDLVKDKGLTADRLTGRFDTKVKKDFLCTHLEELQALDFFGYTSTLTVGVDINFEHFDSLFCDVRNKPLVARDVAQMMARVRKLHRNEIHLLVDQTGACDLQRMPDKDTVKAVLRSRQELVKTDRHLELLRQAQAVTEAVDSDWNEDTGELEHDEDFLELITAFTLEGMASRMDMKSEMKRVCEDKGFEVEEVPLCVFQQDAENLRESQVMAKEKYYTQVSESQVDYTLEEGRVPQEEEEIYAGEKLAIMSRIQCAQELVTPAVVELWGYDGFNEQKADNAARLVRLSYVQGEVDDDIFRSVSDRVLEIRRAGENYDGPHPVQDPRLVQARQLQLMYFFLVQIMGFTYGLLDTQQVRVEEIQQRIATISTEQKHLLSAALHLEFKLSKKPWIGTKFSRVFNACLYEFCGVKIMSKQVRIESRRKVSVEQIERDSVNKLLQYWHIHRPDFLPLSCNIDMHMNERNIEPLF